MPEEVNRSDTFEMWRIKCNSAFEDVDVIQGQILQIQGQLQEINEKIGSLTFLSTNAKDSIVNSINEVNGRIDDL